MAIRKLKNGRFQVDVWDTNGKRIRKNFSKWAEAKAYETHLEKEKQDERLVKHKVGRKKVKLSEAISEAIKSKEPLAKKSYDKYKSVFKTFEEFATSKDILNVNDFTADDADEFRNILTSSDAAPKTINFYLDTVKALFNEYVERDTIAKSPFYHIKRVRLKKKTLLEREEDYYSADEIKSFFKQAMPGEYRNGFIGLFLTGMRFEELSSLKWERIDWVNKIIQIRSDADFKTKTSSSERDIPISNKLFTIIQAIKKNSSTDYVFSPDGKGKFKERKMLSVVKEVAEKAGITKNATLHKWRHSFNSHLSQQGVDYSVRQYLMGHKPQTMTDHYTKVDPKKLHSEVSKLDHLIP
ncbi:MAG: tyrosine-type recombinase/integrase [archaeon]